MLMLAALAIIATLGGVVAIAGATPWLLGILDRDLMRLFFFWLVAVLFATSIEKLSLAMGPDLSLSRVVWLLMALTLFAHVVTGNIRLLPSTRAEYAMVAFLVLALTSKFFMQSSAAELTNRGISRLLTGFVFPFSMFFFARQILRDESRVRSLLAFLVITGVYLSLTALGEHFRFLNGLVFPRIIMNPDAGIHWGRARGPFLNAAANGTVLGMILPLTLYLGLQAGVKPALKKICLATAGLILLALYFTYTRACWLGGFAAAGIMAMYYPNYRKFFLTGLAALAVLAALKWTMVNTSSDMGAERLRDQGPIYNRIYLNDVSWRMIQERPLLGFGLDSFPFSSYRYFRKIKGVPYAAVRGLVNHNTFVAIQVELGMIGSFILLLVYLGVIREGYAYFRGQPQGDRTSRGLVIASAAAASAYFINLLFIDMRFFSFPNSMFFILGGILSGLGQQQALAARRGTASAVSPDPTRTLPALHPGMANRQGYDHAL